MIYLDSAAASRPLPCAIEAVNMVLRDAWANSNSVHAAGQRAFSIIEQAKKTVAQCLGCKPTEVYFVSSASEAAAIVLKTMQEHTLYKIISPFEHDAIADAPENYYGHHYRDKEYGIVQMMVNNETGEIYDIKQTVADHPGDLIATDATAAAGHIPINFSDLGVDYLFCDALKFGGVPGCGILLVKEGAPLSDIMHRPTPPTALIAACASALEWSCEEVAPTEVNAWLCGNALLDEFSHLTNWHINSDTKRVHNILSIRFDGVENTALAALLSESGVMVSTGAACSSGSDQPSRVLMASGLDEQQSRETIRISFGYENTLEEAHEAARIIVRCVGLLRSIGADKEGE